MIGHEGEIDNKICSGILFGYPFMFFEKEPEFAVPTATSKKYFLSYISIIVHEYRINYNIILQK
jgi:hypothetical protein